MDANPFTLTHPAVIQEGYDRTPAVIGAGVQDRT
jgi:hypothetical protein